MKISSLKLSDRSSSARLMRDQRGAASMAVMAVLVTALLVMAWVTFEYSRQISNIVYVSTNISGLIKAPVNVAAEMNSDQLIVPVNDHYQANMDTLTANAGDMLRDSGAAGAIYSAGYYFRCGDGVIDGVNPSLIASSLTITGNSALDETYAQSTTLAACISQIYNYPPQKCQTGNYYQVLFCNAVLLRVETIVGPSDKVLTEIEAMSPYVTAAGGSEPPPIGSATPTPSSTPTPSATPTPTPSASPTPTPSASPTATPTSSPTATPSASPTATPSASPTATPSASPTATPSTSPTATPSASPTATPSTSPTATPSTTPTATPTSSPTGSPTNTPTATPTSSPTGSPTNTPTATPTSSPTGSPTNTPTSTPTSSPTGSPTNTPTSTPTSSPTGSPTNTPTSTPTSSPTGSPTNTPTPDPSPMASGPSSSDPMPF